MKPAADVALSKGSPSRGVSAQDLRQLWQATDDSQFQRGVAGFVAEATGATTIIFSQQKEGIGLLATRLRIPLPAKMLESPEIRNSLVSALNTQTRVVHTLTQAGLVLWAMPINGEKALGLALLFSLSQMEGPEESRILSLLAIPDSLFAQRRLLQENESIKRGLDQTCLFLDTIYRSAAAPSYLRGMQVLAEDLRNFIGADYVAIGLGSDLACKAAALAPASKFDHLSQAMVQTSRLMREALAVGSSVGWPLEVVPESSDANFASDQDPLLELFKAKAVTCHLLKSEDGERLGAWVCWWKSPPTPANWQLAEVLSPHVGATARMIRLARPAGLLGLLQRGFSETKWVQRILLPVLLAITFAVMFLEIPYQVGVSCWIDAAMRRQVAAPFEGILARSHVEPGTAVINGQILAELDGTEIDWKLADVQSRLNSLTKRRDQSLAAENMAETQLASLEMTSLEVERNLLAYQREHLQIRSPLNGLVISGDLAQSEGVPVQRGQRLFDIAPVDSVTVRLAVPATEIRHVAPGMEVRIRLESDAGFKKSTILESLEPISRINESKNVFLGTTTLSLSDESLRPGMRGKARIVTEPKKLGWILFHRPLEYLRLHSPW